MRHVGENEVKFQLKNSTGPMGPAGPAGPQGIPGPIGPRGLTGPAGATGPQGERGPKGDTGPQGATGPKGSDGAPGATGPVGPAGPAGEDGKDGETGPQGPAGPAGADGQAATLEIVAADSLAYGSEPSVTEEAGSTPQARKYRLGIPEGKPGTNGTGNGGSVEIDTTLTQYGQAADAGAVGNAIGQEKQAREQAVNELKEANEQQDKTLNNLSTNKLDASALPTAINTALAQAKESGQFDGKDGEPGAKGDPGDDYVLTEADKEEIAEMAAEKVEVPEGGGGETLVVEETMLASGTISTGTANDTVIDTGLTMADLREYDTVLICRNGSTDHYTRLLFGNKEVWYENIKSLSILAKFADSAKTVLEVIGVMNSYVGMNRPAIRTSWQFSLTSYNPASGGYLIDARVSDESKIAFKIISGDTTADIEWWIKGVVK